MKRYIGIMFVMIALSTYAQKVVPVSQSAITGIALPANSKKDNRGLSVGAGRALLDIEAKKLNASVKSVEILTLPAGFSNDAFITSVTALGWSITPVKEDNKYAWLNKDNRSIIAYISAGNKYTDIYFGETDAAPVVVNTTDTPQIIQKAEVIQQQDAPKAKTDGFAFTTTNFNDGWSSTVYDDYVLTTKGDIKVYLSYIEKFNASEFMSKRLRDHYWETYVSKYFITGTKRFNTGAVSSDLAGAYKEYIEGPATDRQTGQQRYIAMIIKIISGTGTLSVIIASTPSEQRLREQFPKSYDEFYNDLMPMYGYNKFAVGKNDLPGEWKSGGDGASMNWYSTTTGNNVGATAAVSSDDFVFEDNGKYSSIHKGATGWVGAMKTFQQKYNGIYTVTDWTLTATNRFEGKTEVYNAWFEVIKGGRVLHLQNQQYSGQEFSLFKSK